MSRDASRIAPTKTAKQHQPLTPCIIRHEFDASFAFLRPANIHRDAIFGLIHTSIDHVRQSLVSSGKFFDGAREKEDTLEHLTWAINHLLMLKHLIESGK